MTKYSIPLFREQAIFLIKDNYVIFAKDNENFEYKLTFHDLNDEYTLSSKFVSYEIYFDDENDYKVLKETFDNFKPDSPYLFFIPGEYNDYAVVYAYDQEEAEIYIEHIHENAFFIRGGECLPFIFNI